MVYHAYRIVVSKSKQFIVEYTVPSDQVPSGQSVYADIIDGSGSYTGSPQEMSRVGSTDVVKTTLTAPSTVGKYEIQVWIGTWDGTNRSITETVGWIGLEVVDKDIDDRLSDVESQLSTIQSQLSTINDNIETIMKWMKRHPL